MLLAEQLAGAFKEKAAKRIDMDEDEVAKVTIGGREITLCLRANDSSAIVVEVHTPSRSANIQKRINLNRPQRNKVCYFQCVRYVLTCEKAEA